MALRLCICSSDHRPVAPAEVLEDHHLWPIYLGGPAHQATMLWLCATTHNWVHRILRDFTKSGWRLRKLGEPRYAHHIATLGFQAWDAAGRPTPL